MVFLSLATGDSCRPALPLESFACQQFPIFILQSSIFNYPPMPDAPTIDADAAEALFSSTADSADCEISAIDPEQPVAAELIEAPIAAGPVCSQCGAPRGEHSLVVCRKCGYHERLGIVVELDELDRVEDVEQALAAAAPSHLEVWANLIPAWAWLLLVCVLLVVVESVAVRLLTPESSSLRTMWSLSQLGLGFVTLVVAHVLAYTLAISDNDQLKPLDLVLRPIYVWLPSLQALPERLSLVVAGACSLTAMVMSLAVIGGIPYESLWEWGFKEPPKQNLLAAVAEQARKAKAEDQPLEEAIRDFSGQAAVDDQTPEKSAPLPRRFGQCLILGYTPDPDRPDDFESLVLAAVVDNELKEIGTVSTGFTPEARAELNRRMRALQRDEPFVPSLAPAYWIDPRLACRVSFTKQFASGRLESPAFDKLLADVEFGR